VARPAAGRSRRGAARRLRLRSGVTAPSTRASRGLPQGKKPINRDTQGHTSACGVY
jgi:hypothetical protein